MSIRNSYPPSASEPVCAQQLGNQRTRESPIADRLMRNTERLHKATSLMFTLIERLSPISRQSLQEDNDFPQDAEVCLMERALAEQERVIGSLTFMIEAQIDNLRI